MVRDGVPPTTPLFTARPLAAWRETNNASPATAVQSRGWSAFADHDKEMVSVYILSLLCRLAKAIGLESHITSIESRAPVDEPINSRP